MESHEGFIALIGGLWSRDRGGHKEYGFLARSDHRNRNGAVHGGMLMTFADRALGMTARSASGASRSSTVSLTVQFMKPMQIGEFAAMRPGIQRLTRSMAFMAGEVLCHGETIASAQGVWRLARSAG
ncbi:MAG: PaaI family thioesterase [Geminicoccaceae bacterium]